MHHAVFCLLHGTTCEVSEMPVSFCDVFLFVDVFRFENIYRVDCVTSFDIGNILVIFHVSLGGFREGILVVLY